MKKEIKFEEKNGKPYYGGSLYLSGTGITALPDNLTVGGYLDLSGTGITALPDNLTVGGSLYLSGTGITALPDNLTVGGYLDLSGTGITNPKYKQINSDNYLFSWYGEKYIKCDGIFAEVLSKKGKVYRVKKIGEAKEFFIVTDGNGKYAHGDTIKEAKQDLIFKISDRDKSDYENLTKTSVMTFEKAIECYRVITGACSFGTKDFVTGRLTAKKKEYTIAEIIKLTSGEWGNKTFADFFKK